MIKYGRIYNENVCVEDNLFNRLCLLAIEIRERIYDINIFGENVESFVENNMVQNTSVD